MGSAPSLSDALSLLKDKIEVGLNNESANETIQDYSGNSRQLTLLVYTCRKEMKQSGWISKLFGCKSYSLSVQGKVVYIRAKTTHAYRKLEKILSTKANIEIEKLLNEVRSDGA